LIFAKFTAIFRRVSVQRCLTAKLRRKDERTVHFFGQILSAKSTKTAAGSHRNSPTFGGRHSSTTGPYTPSGERHPPPDLEIRHPQVTSVGHRHGPTVIELSTHPGLALKLVPFRAV
jgi:hypothetical protein